MRALLLILAVIRRFEYCRIVVAIPMNSFEIGPDEPTGFFKVCCLINLLFAPLNFGLHSASGLAPFAKVGMVLLVATLVRQLLVLVREPDLLQLLFLNVSSRVVSEIVTSALEFIGRGEFGLLVAVRVECLEWWLVGGALCLGEGPRSVREFDRTGNLSRGGG